MCKYKKNQKKMDIYAQIKKSLKEIVGQSKQVILSVLLIHQPIFN
jgi:hypothetical protein